jgi:hypothetical protein
VGLLLVSRNPSIYKAFLKSDANPRLGITAAMGTIVMIKPDANETWNPEASA